MRFVKCVFLSISVWLAVLANNASASDNRQSESAASARIPLAAKTSFQSAANQ